MRIDYLLLGLLIFSLVFAVGGNVITNMESKYPDADYNASGWENTYNKLNETYTISEDQTADAYQNEIEGADQSYESMIKGGYKAIRRTVGSLGVIKSVMYDLAGILGVDPLFVQFGMTAIIIGITFAALYMVFRFIPR